MSDNKDDLFGQNVPGTTERLHQSTVGIAGCGGLGSNAAVALVRAGVGHLILADFDQVELSNLNRQHYFQSDVGKDKVDALADHLFAINPDVNLTLHKIELTSQNIPQLFNPSDILIEAFDKAESKHWLIEAWCKVFPGRPIVVGSGVSGTGNSNSLKLKKAGHVYFCGDGQSDMSLGLCSARIAIVANMQANVAIALLTESKEL